MSWLAVAVAALLLWGWKTGRLRSPTRAEIFAGLLGVAGAVLAAKGKPLFGLPLLAGAAVLLNRARQPVAASSSMPVDEALRLLDLGPDADAEAIRVAHRRLIARVHPDVGGSDELARRVNLARDTLLGAREDQVG